MENNLWAIVDIFDHALTQDESNEYSFEYIDHHLKNEDRLLNFLTSIYKRNKNRNGRLIVEFDYANLDTEKILHIIERLDLMDKMTFINQLKKFSMKDSTGYFEVESEDILKMFARLCSRELEFVTFHFLEMDISLVGNFDLVYVLFFKDISVLDSIEEIAQKSNVHIRDINMNR